jgi:bacillolysin
VYTGSLDGRRLWRKPGSRCAPNCCRSRHHLYATQSGALNESFADISGFIINNWYTAPDSKDVDTWNWEIGQGLRNDGRPLRDFADPTRTGHPKHMDNFRHLGPGERPSPPTTKVWVHFNSNIHNKAVHTLLTVKKNGARVFAVEDVAVLTYLGMARLTPLATFPQALQAVVDVAQTYFRGSPEKHDKLRRSARPTSSSASLQFSHDKRETL